VFTNDSAGLYPLQVFDVGPGKPSVGIWGVDALRGEIGQVLDAGAPIGLMGGADPDISEFLTQSGNETGTERTETLYIELRKGQKPVDPTGWFNLNKE